MVHLWCCLIAGAWPELHPIQTIKTRLLLFSDLFAVFSAPLCPPLSASSFPWCLLHVLCAKKGLKVQMILILGICFNLLRGADEWGLPHRVCVCQRVSAVLGMQVKVEKLTFLKIVRAVCPYHTLSEIVSAYRPFSPWGLISTACSGISLRVVGALWRLKGETEDLHTLLKAERSISIPLLVLGG